MGLGTEKKTRMTVLELYLRKKFYVWQRTAVFFGKITLMTQGKQFLPSLGKIVSVYIEAEVLLSGLHI